MAAVIVKLSEQGQILIPQEVREVLHWQPGEELTLITTGEGVLLQSSPPPGKRNLADLRGMLKRNRPPIPLEELTAPP